MDIRHQVLTLTRRGFAIGVAAVVAFGLMPTIGSASAQDAGGVLRVGVNRAPNRLDPLQHRFNAEYMLGEMLYNGLTHLKPDMSAEPDLALSWESNDDFTVWTFKLRGGVKFHHGKAFTADDVVATFEAILDPDVRSPGRRNIGPVESVTAVDDLTVRFKLSSSYGDLPVALAYTNAKILPADILRNEPERLITEAFGTGPFKLVEFDPSRRVVVERNPDYFVAGQPLLDGVVQLVFPDSTAEVNAFLNGETDLMIEVPPPDFQRVSDTSGIIGMRTASGRFTDIVMDNAAPPFDDVRVRRALQLTIDREAMVELVAEGFGRTGSDTPIMESYRFDAKLPLIKQDIAEAKRLLAEAGYADGLEIELVASERPALRARVALVLREMAKPAGFNITVKTMPHAQYIDQVWRKGNFYVGHYNQQPNEDSILNLLYTTKARWNQTRWNSAEFDRLVEAGRSTSDDAKRAQLYADAQALMRKEAPALIPIFLDLLGARHDYVNGFVLHARGAVFDMHKVSLTSKAPTRQ